jgi:N-acetylneuraminic acid mutarotase
LKKKSIERLHTYGGPSGSEPCKRNNHAGDIIGKYLVIIGGESTQGMDLNDFYFLDLETRIWTCPKVKGISSFHPVRFHTVTTIGSKLYVFGGCHGNYKLHNQLYEFDMSEILETKEKMRNEIKYEDEITTAELITREYGPHP